MCGIFGLAFTNQTHKHVLEQLFNGLEALEYRGYDSAGIAVQMSNAPSVLHLHKSVGRTTALRAAVEQSMVDQKLDETSQEGVAIAHTRWATHGPATHFNAHPHTSISDGAQFTVVHNGIVTNHADLRAFLVEKNYSFYSDTDTEVVAVLCSHVYRTRFSHTDRFNFAELVNEVVSHLEGAYALLFISSLCPDQLVATKRGSPLIIGMVGTEEDLTFSLSKLKKNTSGSLFYADVSGSRAKRVLPATKERAVVKNTSPKRIKSDTYYFSSDNGALAPHVANVLYLEDGMIAHVDQSRHLMLYSGEIEKTLASETNERVSFVPLNTRLESISKHGFADFMLKEIMEQPDSVAQTLAGRLGTFGAATKFKNDAPQIHLGGLDGYWKHIKKCRRLLLIGCGTSYNAALVVRALLEKSTDRPVQVEIASDFLDRSPPIFRDDVCIFISQSGETADTLQALHYCRSEGDALCIGVVNTIGSSISRLTDCGLHLNCGKEIGVASTKAYTSQIVALVLIALRFRPSPLLLKALVTLPEQVCETLKMCRAGSLCFAKRLFEEDCRSLLLLGRSQQYATCREGALKIKEIAYVYTEAIASGELKHGSVALVDADAHMIVLATHDDAEGKVRLALSQLMARGGRPFLISDDPDLIDNFKNQCRDCLLVPKCVHPALQCVLNVLPMQLIAYDLAKKRGYDVDKPRNLAKSVTVE